MTLYITKQYQKMYKKLPKKIQNLSLDTLQMLLDNPKDISLRLHQLKGSRSQFWSINIDHDYRILFLIDDTMYILQMIGTHAQLYG